MKRESFYLSGRISILSYSQFYHASCPTSFCPLSSFCPICNAEISSKLLVKDVFFVDVLSKSGEWDDEVVVYADGSWHPRARKDVKRETEAASDEVVLEDDDDAGDVDDGDDIQVTNVKKAEAVVVDLTEDSFVEVGDDDDDVVVL